MEIASIIPILRIFDEAKAREFYLEFLGFTSDWEHRFGDDFPIYMQISRGDAVLHLTEHHGDATPGAHILLRAEGIATFQAELAGKSYRYAKPGLDDWVGGGKCVVVTDPFMNKLTFAGPD